MMLKKAVRTYIEKLESLDLLDNHNLSDDILDIKVDCLTYDSRKLFGKSIFICKGSNFKSEYLHDAVDKGAIAYISEKQIDNVENYILVKDIRSAICNLALFHFDNPANGITTIGITGTKGKSTVAYILKSIMDLYLADNGKEKAGLVSSIEIFDGKEMVDSALTTPEPMELQEYFYNAKSSGLEYMIMEASSQALKYERSFGIPFKVACFTNFGKDHISNVEHKSVEDYFESKLKIFDNAEIACINSGSDKFDDIQKYAQNKCDFITYGFKPEDKVVCSNIQVFGNGCSFHVKSDVFDEDFYLPMLGEFNVENALAAIAIAYSLKIPINYIIEGVKTAQVPGRMKIIDGKNVKVVIDYAHNEMSFEALFASVVKQYPGYKIIGIFGCPGDKAPNRREEMPRVASKYCNHIIVCEDDPATESFEDIAKQMEANILIDNYEIIKDRQEALKHAIDDLSKDKTVIVFAGKGEDNYMIRGHEHEPYDGDLNLAKKLLS